MIIVRGINKKCNESIHKRYPSSHTLTFVHRFLCNIPESPSNLTKLFCQIKKLIKCSVSQEKPNKTSVFFESSSRRNEPLSKKQINKSRRHIYILHITSPVMPSCHDIKHFFCLTYVIMFTDMFFCFEILRGAASRTRKSGRYLATPGDTSQLRGLDRETQRVGLYAVKMFRLQFTLNSRRRVALAYVYKSRRWLVFDVAPVLQATEAIVDCRGFSERGRLCCEIGKTKQR